MKRKIFISAAVLLLSAALSAQTTQQSRPQGQGKTQAHDRTREQSGTMTQTREKKEHRHVPKPADRKPWRQDIRITAR